MQELWAIDGAKHLMLQCRPRILVVLANAGSAGLELLLAAVGPCGGRMLWALHSWRQVLFGTAGELASWPASATCLDQAPEKKILAITFVISATGA